MANRGQGAATPTTATGRERTNLALVDIAPPGVADNVGIFAFRAGDEIPPTWIEQHSDYLTQLADDAGAPVYRAGTLAEAPEIAENARGAGGTEP